MPRKTARRMLRVDDDLTEKMELFAGQLRWSFNQFGEEAIKAIVQMIEDPSRRQVPDIVVQLDALRAPRALLDYPGRGDDIALVGEEKKIYDTQLTQQNKNAG